MLTLGLFAVRHMRVLQKKKKKSVLLTSNTSHFTLVAVLHITSCDLNKTKACACKAHFITKTLSFFFLSFFLLLDSFVLIGYRQN